MITSRSRRQFLQLGSLTLGGAVTGFPFSSDIILPSARDDEGKGIAAQKTIRGVMVDAGRVPESIDYYQRVIEFCAEWGLNTLHFRLADDQGSALRFASVAGLVHHVNAFTPDQMRRLTEYGAKHGIDVIPELESFGHTGYITRSRAYSRLLDTDNQGTSEFSGVCPVNPETLDLFSKLYREVASIFPSPYLHGGCDEVNWGGSDLSRKALRARSRAQIWGEYLNGLNGLSKACEKQLIVWGDFVLHKEPNILPLLDKSIIVMDWNYSANNALPVHDALMRVRANGSPVIGAPALTCHGWGARVGTEQLRNIDAYADAYFGTNDSGVMGVILTNWIPSRYLQDSIWDGFAYAAVAFNKGTAVAETSAFHRFVEQHYQAEWNEMWDQVFTMLYHAAPHLPESSTASWMGMDLSVPWSNDAALMAVLGKASPRSNPFTKLSSSLATLEGRVRMHLHDFQSFKLAVMYLEQMFWREATVVEQRAHRSLNLETAARLIQKIAERDAALAVALSEDWNRGRFADSRAKSELLFGLQPQDQLLYQWSQAAKYSASLAKEPHRFLALIQGTSHHEVSRAFDFNHARSRSIDRLIRDNHPFGEPERKCK